MNLLSILSGVLKLANLIAGFVKDEQLMDAGEQKQIAKSLAQVVVATDTARLVDEEVSAMTDEQVDAALEGDFR